MILVVGGSYQEKLKFVIDKFSINENEIVDCNNVDLLNLKDLRNYKVIDNFENFIYEELKNDRNPEKDFSELSLNDDMIIICDDLACGVVPIDKFYRDMRETTGRLLCSISKNSNEVYNVLYGVGKKVK